MRFDPASVAWPDLLQWRAHPHFGARQLPRQFQHADVSLPRLA
jgi:hypothetical protein